MLAVCVTVWDMEDRKMTARVMKNTEGVFYIIVDGKVAGNMHATMQEAYTEIFFLNHKGLEPFEMIIRFR